MVRGTHRARSAAPSPALGSLLLPALVGLAIVAGVALGRFLKHRQRTPRVVAPAPWVDPTLARLQQAPAWVDPRWLEHLAVVMEEIGPLELVSPPRTVLRKPEASTWVETAATLERLRTELAGLSFVRTVEFCQLSARGLEVELVLRKPVACLPVLGGYALVDEEGVVLEGRWPVPPRLGRAFLPILGPSDDPRLADIRSGDWLEEPEHLDALDVALSMTDCLEEDVLADLGRVVIDARGATTASVLNPGVRLELEGGRSAFFGRIPSSGEPGELSASHKWRSLAKALELFRRDPVGGDWDRVDLRWDRPDLALRRPPEVASLVPEEPRTRVSRARSEASPARARVR